MEIIQLGNKSIKEHLIERASEKTSINTNTISDIINFQFKDLKDQLKTSAKSIQIAGFGKFIFRPLAALREKANLERILSHLESNDTYKDRDRKIRMVSDDLAFINMKLGQND